MAPNDESTSLTKERASLYVYVASLYFLMVAVLYLWGYWSQFGINILQYISFTDVLKLALYPVASSFGFFLVGALISHLGQMTWPLPSGRGRDTPLGRALNRHKQLLSVVYVLGTLTLWIFGPVAKWFLLPAFLALPIAIVLKSRGLFCFAWPDEAARSTIIFLLAALPLWAYGQGRVKAAEVTSGSAYDCPTADTIDNLRMGDPSDSKNRVKYLGQINDYVFLLLPDDTLRIVRFDKTHGLQFRHHSGAQGNSPSSSPRPQN